MPATDELRKRMGLPPITTNNANSEESTQTDGEPQPSGDDNGGVKNGNDGGGPNEGNLAQALPANSDEAFLARLRELNPNIKSLDEIRNYGQTPEPEDEEKKRKRRASAILTFGLKNELVSRDTYDRYQIDNAKTPRQIVYEAFAEKRKAKGASPAQIEREFKKLYHEDIDPESLDDDDREYATAVMAEAKEALETEARRIVKKRYPEVFSLEAKYDEHVSATAKEQENRNRVVETTRQYAKDVDEIFAGIPDAIYRVGDEGAGDVEELRFDYTKNPELLKKVKEEFLQNSVALGFIANYNKDVLKDAIILRVEKETEAARMSHIARKYHAAQMAKVKVGRQHLTHDDIGTHGDGNSTGKRDERMRERLKTAGYFPAEN